MVDVSVKFNVGGKIFEVKQELLKKFPDTMMLRAVAEMSDMRNEPIFINRNGDRFVYVLDYMRDGKAHLPITISKCAFISDLAFYGIEVTDSSVILVGSVASQIKRSIKYHEEQMA
jgi:BTB/POZ domain